FFRGTVQQPDVRVSLLDHLAIELEHQAQHAMSRRVLGPEVHGVVADLDGGGRGHQRGTCGSFSAGSERWSWRITFGTSTRGVMLTGWYTTRCRSGSYCTSTLPLSGKSLRNGCPMKP